MFLPSNQNFKFPCSHMPQGVTMLCWQCSFLSPW